MNLFIYLIHSMFKNNLNEPFHFFSHFHFNIFDFFFQMKLMMVDHF